MEKKKQIYGMIAALVANMIFGFSFIFSKTALSFAAPLTILAARFTLAFVFLNILTAVFKIKLNFKNKPKVKLVLMGLAQPLLYFIFELYGLSLVSSALSGVIIALVPVGVMLLAVAFLGEKPTTLQIVCTVLSIVGVSLISVISNDGSKSYFLGVVLLILAVVCASVFNCLSREESKRFSPFERTYMMFLLAAVGFNLIALTVSKANYFTELAAAFKEPLFLSAIIYLSLFSSVIAFVLYNYSTTVISVVQSSSFSNIITVVTVVAGIIILKENFGFTQILLCLLIVLGVWGVNTFTQKK